MKLSAAVSAALATAFGCAYGAEMGGSVYPHGTENFLVGALPPPGLYGIVYLSNYKADRLNDKDGNNLKVPGFKVRANAVAPRLVWRPDAKLLGGNVVVHTIVPLVDLKVSAAGATQSKSGLGDVVVGTGLGYHHSATWHSVVALDTYWPTGDYGKRDLANIGLNHAAIEPLYILSHIDPGGLNGDIKMGYIVNRRNSATDYKSGDEFHFDYSLGWGLGNGWTVGVGGYYRHQVTQDKVSGTELSGSKTSGYAIGPNIKYDSGKGWFMTTKWQAENNVKNGSQGSAFWVKVVFPL